MIQFQENLGIMSKDSLSKIQQLNVIIIGLGGLGGHISNTLTRLGVEKMTLIDFDVFTLSNLNRQLFSTQQTINKYKVDVVAKALLEINSEISLTIIKKKVQLATDNTFKKASILIDAVDDISTKLYLENLSNKLNIPLFHGAISGWFGQVGISMPNSFLLHNIYHDNFTNIAAQYKSPSFTPAIIANIMVGEIVKYVCSKEKALINKIIQIDILNHDYNITYKK